MFSTISDNIVEYSQRSTKGNATGEPLREGSHRSELYSCEIERGEVIQIVTSKRQSAMLSALNDLHEH